VLPFDLTWLELARWPLVLALLAVGLFFLRRGPERSEPWQPPESPEPPRVEPPAAEAAPATPSTLDEASPERPASRPRGAPDPD
jgi:hypothetical protein